MFGKREKKSDSENISIEILKAWNAQKNEFYARGVLIKVVNGKEMLREVYGEYEDKTYWSFG